MDPQGHFHERFFMSSEPYLFHPVSHLKKKLYLLRNQNNPQLTP
jgi:hypothetical protein